MSERNRKGRQTNKTSEWPRIERPELKPSRKGKVARGILEKFGRNYDGLILEPSEYHLDHIAYNGDEFISEPYSLTLEQLKKTIELCEEKGLTFYITGRSYHYPGETLRVVFTKEDEMVARPR